jgi:hypothetical protein
MTMKVSSMTHSLENTLRQFQLGEELIAEAVEALIVGWQASTVVIGKLCTGAERWQAAIRQMQAPVNFAEILRARTIL